MQLERLGFVSKRSHIGAVKGERKSPRRGSSVEFADYRPYEVGDDLRYVDWNAFARLNRLYLKVFIDEEDLCIHLLLDASGSMDYGTPNKFRYAVRLAAALAFIGFVNLERVGVGGVPRPQSPRDGSRRAGGTSSCRSRSFLANLTPGGGTAFNDRPSSTRSGRRTPGWPWWSPTSWTRRGTRRGFGRSWSGASTST